MGYTHYFEVKAPIDPEAFRKLSLVVTELVELPECPKLGNWAGHGDPASAPEITSERISLNGLGANAHETFSLELNSSGFNFCKTARKPYDVAIVAILCLADLYLGGALVISSDGSPDEWEFGLALARKIDLNAQIPGGVWC